MRLLLVTHFYPAHGGGVEVVASALAQGLAARPGWSVVWAASDCDPPPTARAALRPLPMRSWNGFERRFGFPWPVWSPFALYRLWREIGSCNVVHLHDALYFGNICAWLFARLRSVPVVVTQHVGDVPFNSKLLRQLHALANRSLGRWVLQGAARVVFISPAVRDFFAAFCRFRKSPNYWSNGVDTDVYRPEGAVTDDAMIVAARKAGRPVLLFVGRFVEKKGLATLRSLAEAFQDALWIFAGHGPLDPQRWELPNVVLVRGQSGERLARYYRAADLLVLPSVGEGFPLVVQEAMACGLPAMVGEETAKGCPAAVPYLVVENVGPADTVQRWSLRLRGLLCRPETLRAMRADAARFAHKNWSWDSAVSSYDELFVSLRSRSTK